MGFIATLGGLLVGAIALVFIPEFRQFLIDFFWVGWAGFALICLTFPLLRMWSTRKATAQYQAAQSASKTAETAKAQAENAVADAEAAAKKAEGTARDAELTAQNLRQELDSLRALGVKRAKDLDLLESRIEGWGFADSNFRYLQRADHEAFAEDFYEALCATVERWHDDPRPVMSADLRPIWAGCKQAASAYLALLHNLARKPGRNGQFRYVPYELRHEDVEQYTAMNRQLDDAKAKMVSALNAVHNAIHLG
ncbi:hypothetical protein TV39_04655 [Arthrobacter sp. SPG23]|nr:hypothetical protein TV39_04655 [Arthrobacter sp. SPG23]